MFRDLKLRIVIMSNNLSNQLGIDYCWVMWYNKLSTLTFYL